MTGWPLIDESIGFATGPGTPSTGLLTVGSGSTVMQLAEGSLWVSVLDRTEGQWTSQRGRQYELDQVQAATVASVLRNTDGALDPSNEASPFWPLVKMFRSYRRRARVADSVNILMPGQTQGPVGSPSWSAVLKPGSSDASEPGAFTTVNPTVWDPASGLAFALLTTFPANSEVCAIGGWTVMSGASHAAQMTIGLGTSGSDTITGALQFNWYMADGSVSTTVGAPGTTVNSGGYNNATLTVVGTAPAGCVGGTISLILAGPPATAGDYFSWLDVQIEYADTCSAYVDPAPWFDIVTGYVDGWPQQWDDGGTYGTTQLAVTDAFGYLSQRPVYSPGYAEALSAGASWFYPLDEPQSATSWSDLTGNTGPMFAVPLNGASVSQCVAGESMPTVPANHIISVAFGYTYGFTPLSIGGPVTQFTNSGSSAAVLDLGSARGVVGPPSGTGWTMMFMVYMPASTTPGSNTATQVIWAADDGTGQNAMLLYTSGSSYVFRVDKGGTVGVGSLTLTGPAGVVVACDGGWHLIIVTMSADGKTLTGYLDTGSAVVDTAAADMRPTFAGGFEALGAHRTGWNAASNGFTGSLACVGMIPVALPHSGDTYLGGVVLDSVDQPNIELLQAVLADGAPNGATFQSTTSGRRFQDILRWAGWVGARAIDDPTQGDAGQPASVPGPGTCVTYGPPSEFVSAAAGGSSTDCVSALQTVTDTENGTQFVDKSGRVTFAARLDRYSQDTVLVFGEGATGPSRTNLCINPVFATSALSGWNAGGATIMQDTSQYHYQVANQSLKVTGTGSSSGPYSDGTAVTAGDSYAASSWLYVGTTLANDCKLIGLGWYDSGGTLLSTVWGPTLVAGSLTVNQYGSAAWQQFAVVGQAPAGAASVRVLVAGGTLATGEVVNVAGVLLEQADGAGPFFDGDTADTAAWAYEWTGTTDASPSTMTAIEVPYTSLTPGFDAARLADDIQLQQTSTGVGFRRIADAQRIADYGDVQLSRSVNTESLLEIQDALTFLLERYQDVSQRIDSITVDVVATGAWEQILGLELGSPVQVIRRPPSPAPVLALDLFVENIAWTMGGDDATVVLELSPAAGLDYWLLDSSEFSTLGVSTICGY